MHSSLPPLNALRAFEAAARHLSISKAAEELSVTAGALSHQIKGLEAFLGVQVFERRPRAIALAPAGQMLYPGLRAAFADIREAVASVHRAGSANVLVISTPPGFTGKWLAPRLYKFSNTHPEIEARVSSQRRNANFITDGVDLAIRNLPINHQPDVGLVAEPLIEITYLPVCTPGFLQTYGPFHDPAEIANVPLIHDVTFSDRPNMPQWSSWLAAAGVRDVNLRHGLQFDSPDHALDATVEGAGILLAHSVLAWDDLRSGRLVAPFALTLSPGRAFHLVYPETVAQRANIVAFRSWIGQEVAAAAQNTG